MVIMITKRTKDYVAWIEGHPEIWANGNTPREAIGNLVWTHTEHFGIVGVRED
jgi:hypothetical protein